MTTDEAPTGDGNHFLRALNFNIIRRHLVCYCVAIIVELLSRNMESLPMLLKQKYDRCLFHKVILLMNGANDFCDINSTAFDIIGSVARSHADIQ